MSTETYPTPSWDSVLASTCGLSALVEGQHEAGVAGDDTTIDFQFDTDREIQGGDVSAWNAAPGDSVSVSVFSSATPPTEVRRVANNAQILASKSWSLRVGYSLKLPAGFIFRVVYHSVGATAPDVSANLLTWLSGDGT